MTKTILFFCATILIFVVSLGGVAALRCLTRRIFRNNEKGEVVFYFIGVLIVAVVWFGRVWVRS